MLPITMADVPAWVVGVTAVVPAATGVAGYWLAGRNEEARDERAAEREERARVAGREENLDDERQAFQREVLLELQGVLLASTRTATEALVADRKTLREHGQRCLLGDDLNQRLYDTRVALLRIGERVLNDELRQELNALQEFTAHLLLPPDRRDADPAEAIAQLDAAMEELGQRHARVNEILGRQLRAVLGRSASASS